jgi:hypothetical protein
VLSAASDGTVCLWDPAAPAGDPPPYGFAYDVSGLMTIVRSPGPGLLGPGIPWPDDDTHLDEDAAMPGTIISPFPDLGLYAEWVEEPHDPAYRSFRLCDETTDTVVDEIQLDATPIHSAAVNASTLAIVDGAGHLSFWHIA